MQKTKIIENECIALKKIKIDELKWFQVQEVTGSHSEQKEQHSNHTRLEKNSLCLLFTLRKM